MKTFTNDELVELIAESMKITGGAFRRLYPDSKFTDAELGVFCTSTVVAVILRNLMDRESR